jgi:hypothetical protein
MVLQKSGSESPQEQGFRLFELYLSKLFDCDTKRILQQVASALVISHLTGQQVPQAAAVTLSHL